MCKSTDVVLCRALVGDHLEKILGVSRGLGQGCHRDVKVMLNKRDVMRAGGEYILLTLSRPMEITSRVWDCVLFFIETGDIPLKILDARASLVQELDVG